MLDGNTIWYVTLSSNMYPTRNSNKLLTSLCNGFNVIELETAKDLVTRSVLFEFASVIKHIAKVWYCLFEYTELRINWNVKLPPSQRQKSIAFLNIEVVIVGNNRLPLSIGRHYPAKAHARDYNTTGCCYKILSLNLITMTEELLLLILNKKAATNEDYTWSIFWGALIARKENITWKSRHNKTSLIIRVIAKF